MDHSRPADIGWVEQMKTKHDRLPTNYLALVSKSGFSKEAYKVAKSYGIETIKLEKEIEELKKDINFENKIIVV